MGGASTREGEETEEWRLWRSASEGSSLNEKAVMKGRYVAASEASESMTYALNDPALAAAVATIIRAPPEEFRGSQAGVGCWADPDRLSEHFWVY
ncbi:hypothetical protein MLD38_029483 [Melastoma candidum]|uniref:Uncharacterized protein n=1 Tax=Melastoma candidum TaxID=119954 RepID=A0ACB9N6C0_9MYRT|nr:hypothetical protein MLD38_029483 [Melastoma candidum]